MIENTRRDFLKKTAAAGAAFLTPKLASAALGANDRVRVAMIGVGSRGQELLKQIVAVPGTQVVAIADVYTRRFDEAKNIAPGIQTFDDHRRVLDMKDIDGVIVASPLHIHSRHFIDTLAAGKDLYAEKNHDVVDSRGRKMPRRCPPIRPRGSNRLATPERRPIR